MENQQLQQQTVDTRVKDVSKKTKKREYKNRKTFSLKAMEALVDKVSFLENKYDSLAINAKEKLGYHYNEILNILLFHKYVKSNKKLFEMYKKIKDAINKGYEFKKEKRKKVNENTMKNMMKNNKGTHFAINKKTNKILESWNYDGYEHNELKNHKDEYFTKDVKRNYPFLNENDVVVVNAQNLEKRQLNENNKKDWQRYNYSHFALLKETNHILYGYDYSDVDSNELTKNKNKYFLKVLSETYGSEITPKDVVVVKSNKLKKLGIKDYLNESNWVGLINEAYYGSKMDEGYGMSFEEAKAEAKRISDEEGGVAQHVNKIGDDMYEVSDWYDSDTTVASFGMGIDEEMDDNVYEYEVPDWALPTLINGDSSGISDEDEQKIERFINQVVNEVGNANFYGGSEEDGLGFRRSNDIDNLGSEVYKVYVRKHTLDESSDVGSVFGAEGMPVANPYMRPKKGFDLSPNQDMYKAKNMLPSVKKGIKKFQSEFSNPVFKQTTEPEFITPVKTTHFQGTKKKAMKENYDLVDLDALMNDDIIEYKKLSTNNNVFKSPKIELIRENNRDSISEFIIKYQGRELPEVYNRKQLDNLALKTLNEYYNRLVQRLGLLEEEKKHDALVRIDALKKQSQKDSNSYYKKDASNKTTTMLVQKGEGDGLVYDKDSLEKKDIPKYQYQSEHQKQYLEKGHRGLEDFVPEPNPNGETDPVWLARKEALMSTQEVGANAFKAAQKRIQYKKEHGLGKTRGRTVKLTQDLPKVDKADELLKENSFDFISESNILNQIQSYYIDEDNRKKPVIFDANNIVEKFNKNKLMGCKELTYKGLGQTLTEDFKDKVLNRKLLYSPESKKVYLV